MITAQPAISEEEGARRDALAGHLFESAQRTAEMLNVYLGERLGLYRALSAGDRITPAELGRRAGIDRRYAREWLEQQASAGVVTVEDAGLSAEERRFRLPGGHAEVLVNPDSTSYLAGLARLVGSVAGVLPELLSAYRTGGGVPWSAYGADAREGQAVTNRPLFLSELGTSWFPAMPELHARLQADPPARIADIGCGAGWSSIAMARAYPKVQVEGFDSDEASVLLAQTNAADSGVAFRTSFEQRDAAGLHPAGYDLITIFEALHDMSRPTDVLHALRRALAPGGSVLVVDERVHDQFLGQTDELDRFMYAISTLMCLPASMAEDNSEALGTVLRPETVRRLAAEAGFARVEVEPVESPLFRFYRLLP